MPDFRVPLTYMEIKPTKGGKPNLPESELTVIVNFTSQMSLYDEACEWMNKMVEESYTVKNYASFATFHAQNCADIPIYKSTSHFLPLIHKSVNSQATVQHSMAQVKALTECKSWPKPGNHRRSACLCHWKTGTMDVFRIQELRLDNGAPSHRDGVMAAVGDWLEGSGWKEIYEVSMVSTSGRVDRFLKGKEVKRTRYSYAITLWSLVTLQRLLPKINQNTLTTKIAANTKKNDLSLPSTGSWSFICRHFYSCLFGVDGNQISTYL